MKKIYAIFLFATLLVASTNVSAQADVGTISNIIVMDDLFGGGKTYTGTGVLGTDFTGQEIMLEQDSFIAIQWTVSSNNTSNVERQFMVIKNGNAGNANVGEFINDIQTPGSATVFTKEQAHKIPASAPLGAGLFFRVGGKIYLAGQNENPEMDPNGNQAGWLSAVDVPFTVVAPGTLSTSNKNAFEFAMYPNPVKDKLHINTRETIEKIEIFDLLGKRVLTSEMVSETVDVSSLNKALYIVKLSSDNGVSTKKFIKK